MTKSCLTLFVFLLLAFSANSQSIKDLQNQKRRAENEISKINDQLNATKKEKNSSIKQAVLINNMISKRKKIISNIDEQVVLLSASINQKGDTVVHLMNEIDKMKANYAKTIVKAYKMRNVVSSIGLVIGSSNIHQAIIRMKYLRSYSDYRIQQAKNIEGKQTLLKNEIVGLNAKKQNLVSLLSQKKSEVEKLDKDEKSYEALIAQLKTKEKQLTKQVEKQRLLSERLTHEINKIIEEEARKAAEAARRAAKAKAKKNKTNVESSKTVTVAKELPFTPEDRIIAGKFEANKGRLPWPVRQGQIVEEFGEHFHPILKGIKIENKGVDISSNVGSDVMSVYSGEVSKVFVVPGANYSVLVRHGYYITVYSNLVKVSVKEGQSISSKQVIGTLAASDDGSSKSVLKFQVWRENTPQNPRSWLSH